jgi:hypothetical protein
LRSAQFDPVPESAEFADHSLSALLFGHFADLLAAFLVADSKAQDLPDQTTKFVGYHCDGVLVSQARYITVIENLEDASFVSDRRVGGLIENAPVLTTLEMSLTQNPKTRQFLS